MIAIRWARGERTWSDVRIAWLDDLLNWAYGRSARPPSREEGQVEAPLEWRDRYVRELHDEGFSVRAIAFAVALGQTQVRTILGDRIPKRPAAPSRDELLSAGLAWLAYYRAMPTSAAWNRTLARGSDQSYYRWELGWYDAQRPTRRIRWPNYKSVNATFGGFQNFTDALKAEVQDQGEPDIGKRRPRNRQLAVAVPPAQRDKDVVQSLMWRRTMERHSTRGDAQREIDSVLIEAVIEARQEIRDATSPRMSATARATTRRGLLRRRARVGDV